MELKRSGECEEGEECEGEESASRGGRGRGRGGECEEGED